MRKKNVLSESLPNLISNQNLSDHSQFPTLLHFAAFHGLKNLCSVLLECPGVRVAIDVKNANDLTPPELAQLNSHVDLAEMLFNFQVN